jgi:hypothetical protein
VLPVLHVKFGLRQACHLPGLTTTAIPIDICIAECHEPQGEIAALIAFRVEADRHDWQCSITPGELLHLPGEPILILIRQGAADPSAP